MDNQGISKVGVVVSVLALVALVVTGWFWYQSEQDDNSEVADVDSEEEEEAPRYPDGWVEYGDSELGFSFAYPQEWGEVETEQDEGMTGVAFSASFSGNDNVTLAAESTGYESVMGPSAISGAQGWGVDNGVYHFNRGADEVEVQGANEFEAWEGDGLYQVDTSPEEAFDANEVHRASFNLSAGEYDGVVFIYRLTDGQTIADTDDFRDLTRSVELF